MDERVRSEWLAELLASRRDLITEYWIKAIRAEDVPGYQVISDERLHAELPPTVESMIHAVQTGDTEGPRKHSLGVIQQRLADGVLLPDLQRSLHALLIAVMKVVTEAGAGLEKQCEALMVGSTMYYLVALIAAEVYEQLRQTEQARFAAAYEFGIALSRSLELDAVLDTAVHQVASYLKGDSAAILLTNLQGRDEVRSSHNMDADLVEALPDICESLGCGAPDATGDELPEATCTISDVRTCPNLAQWSEFLASRDRVSMVCAPLMAKRKDLGTVIVLWSDFHSAAGHETNFLLAMAGHIANAVQNAILYEEAKGKRQLDILLDASRLFASSLETRDIPRKMARMATEAAGADLGVVLTTTRAPGHGNIASYAGSEKAAAVVHRIVEAAKSLGEQQWFDRLGPDFTVGESIVFSRPEDFPEALKHLAETVGVGLAAPLAHRETLLGELVLMSLSRDAFSDDDVMLASGLADQAAVAMDNARLYEYERRIADTLQQSFLPSELPEVGGYEFAAYYRPAAAEAEVGGDFYDVFILGNGATGIVMGDVSGKGLDAATSAAMGKHMIRAFAAEELSPSGVLRRFNSVFFEGAPEGVFITVFYGVLDPRDDTLTYVGAGHEPPLFFSAELGHARELRTTGTCVGVGPHADYADEAVQLLPRDILFLYTDGATDAKRDHTRFGIEALRRLLESNANKSAKEVVRAASGAIVDYSRGKLADDVALVVIRRR